MGLWINTKLTTIWLQSLETRCIRQALPRFRHILAQFPPQFTRTVSVNQAANWGTIKMTPVTEDQVQALLSGLEKREKEALRALTEKASDMTQEPGRMTAKILKLRVQAEASSPQEDGSVVALARARKERRRRVTSKGFFYYTSEPRALPSS